MTTIRAIAADITALDVDVIVNAANSHLQHGGGVALAIARAGGSQIQRESDDWVRRHGTVEAGEAAATSAGTMPARHVVHVVGPRYREGQDNEELLRQAVAAALQRTADLGGRSVAMPAISAGIFGYPLTDAAHAIAAAVTAWCTAHAGALDEVLLVGFDDRVAAAFRDALEP